jgi:hypothetical protein
MCKYCIRLEGKYFWHPLEGDLRIWWIPQVPMQPFHYPITSIAEAKHMLDAFAMYDLFQLEHNIKPDFSNGGGLEVYEDGEWVDWYDTNGLSIDEVDDNGNSLD